jgi:ABC-type Co2+ transport system permease subunit
MYAPERHEPSTLGTLAFILWGLIVWGLQFTAVYVGHTWLCALGASAAATGLLTALLTVLAVALILPVAVMPDRMAKTVGLRPADSNAAHIIVIARAVALLSIVAALWTGSTAVFLDPCALGR